MADESKSGALKISSRDELESWLKSLPRELEPWVAVAIAARAALRVVPLIHIEMDAPHNDDAEHKRRFESLAFAVFFAVASARAWAKYPTQLGRVNARPAAHAAATASQLAAVPRAIAAARCAVGAAGAAAEFDTTVAAWRLHALNAVSAAAAAVTGDAAFGYMAAQAAQAKNAAQAKEAAKRATDEFAADLWESVTADANFIRHINSAGRFADIPLWAKSNTGFYGDTDPLGVNIAPDWFDGARRKLFHALSSDVNWGVWIDWSDRRLEGVSDPAEVELVFATVPEKEREAGPAAANNWIKERLAELRKKDSPPPEIPRQGPGPHVEIDAETGAVVPAKPESLDAEGNNLARLNALHPQIVRLAGELIANLGQNEQPELFAAAKSYFDNINRDLSQIDFERLWGEGVYLEEAEAAAARRIKDAMREPLNDAALTALNALLRIHGPFILATKAGLENLADANAFEMRPDEAKEQRAAAIELAQEFKANQDVVAPETAANFAHFAEQPDLTKHPERSGAFRMGMALNAAIVLTAGATIGVIIVEIGLATGNPIAGLAALALVEGLKKSKPFLEVSGLVTEGLNKLSEEDARALWERLRSKIPFDRYRQFVLDNEALFRRLAGSGKQSRWLHEILDWLTRTTEPPK